MKQVPYLADAALELKRLKRVAEEAWNQISAEEFLRPLGPEQNAVGLIVKHLAGNLRSRWRDFLTTDGEKPDRDRDQEFILSAADTLDSLTRRWEEGWRHCFDALEQLGESDLKKTITIRGEPHTVLQAIQRQLTHNAYHVGQIVLLSRFFAGERWKTLSIARGASRQFDDSRGA